MIRRSLATLGLAAAIVAVPGVASAHGVNDPTTAPYCGPGAIWVGVNGDANGCAKTDVAPDAPDDAGLFSAFGAAWGIAWLIL